MKRPIKFRGRDKRGNVFYGSYNQDMGIIDDWEYAACHAVDDEDIAQLVGYDANGKEVYEGDILLDYDGQEFVASLQGVVRWETDDKSNYIDMPDHLKTVPFDFTQKFTPLTLKERTP